MCMCIQICMHIHIYMCVCIYVFMHMNIHMHGDMLHIYTCMYRPADTYIHTHKYIYMNLIFINIYI